VAGLVVCFVIVVYIYRQVILTTVITAVIAAVSVCVLVGAVALTLSTIRWYRRQQARYQQIVAGAAEPIVAADTDAAAISDEADWLATGVELAFSPDGKNLVARDKG
jgi:hypothetical protein